MPAFVADLHNHTPASADHHRRSETTAREIVECALAAGLDVYAATDHLSMEYAGELIAAAGEVARETGRELLVVPGAELRITHRDDEAHIVALFDQSTYAQRFGALLGILGVASDLPGEEARPFYTIEHDPAEVCRIIDALGGLAVVAHADRAFGDYRLIDRPLFERLVTEPAVAAVDLVDPRASRSRLDGCRPAVISCSDSHSCAAIGARHAVVEMGELTFEALRRALASGAVRECRGQSPTLKLA